MRFKGIIFCAPRLLVIASCLLTTCLFTNGANAETWLFDFGPSSQTSSPGYNNITNQGIQAYTGLINSDGQTTGLSLTITIPFNQGGTNSNGTTSPAPETGFVANATRDSFFGNTVSFQGNVVPNSQLKISGLDPAQLYDFSIFASRTGVTDNRETEYKITGTNNKTVYLNATENTAEIASLFDMQPAADGTLVLDLAPGPNNTNSNKFFYIGAMKIANHTAAPTSCDASDTTPDDTLIKYPYVAGTSPYGLGHWIYKPVGYSYAPCKKYPLLIWLHGAGEICAKSSLEGLHKSSLNSPGYQILQGTAYTNQRPFLNGIIVEPQTCGSWNPSNIDAMIEYIKSRMRVDENRIYVTGLSLGGGGTWAYAANKSTKVAAVVPIAGTEASLSSMYYASHVPTWAFHNYNDTNTGPGLAPETSLFRCQSYTHRQCTVEHIDRMIPFASERVMQGYSPDHGATQAATHRTASLATLTTGDLLPTQWQWNSAATPVDANAKTIMTIFAASGHGGWVAAYNMQEMWQWLYSQTLLPAPTLKVNSPLVTPASGSAGTSLLISAKISLGTLPLAQLTVDLKSLGGAYNTALVYNGVSKAWELNYTLPANLAPGDKAVGFTAVDTAGNRTVRYATFTITQ